MSEYAVSEIAKLQIQWKPFSCGVWFLYIYALTQGTFATTFMPFKCFLTICMCFIVQFQLIIYRNWQIPMGSISIIVSLYLYNDSIWQAKSLIFDILYTTWSFHVIYHLGLRILYIYILLRGIRGVLLYPWCLFGVTCMYVFPMTINTLCIYE